MRLHGKAGGPALVNDAQDAGNAMKKDFAGVLPLEGRLIRPKRRRKWPAGSFKRKENRVAAIRWLVEKLGKDPKDITTRDFDSNGLSGLLRGYYQCARYKAFNEAGYRVMPWEMYRAAKFFYVLKENRVAAVRWLVGKVDKNPRDITLDDFRLNGLVALTKHYNDCPHYERAYNALYEAGLVTEADREYMYQHSRTSVVLMPDEEKGGE